MAIPCLEKNLTNPNLFVFEFEWSKDLLYESYFSLGNEFDAKKDNNNAIIYYQKAHAIAKKDEDKALMLIFIRLAKERMEEEEIQKNAPTNDPFYYRQYYLKLLNVPNAWLKVTNNKTVIVAVIDDGININHPDLLNSIWTSPNAKYGSSKIIDFVGDGLADNTPSGEH